jgi:hypothetical protein
VSDPVLIIETWPSDNFLDKKVELFAQVRPGLKELSTGVHTSSHLL